MRKIAIVGSASDALINFRLSLLEHLAKENEVYAVCPSFSPDQIEILVKMGVTPVVVAFNRFGLNPFKEIASIFNLCRFFMDYKIDVSLSYFIKPVIYGTIAAFLVGIKKRVALVEGLGFFFTWQDSNMTTRQKLLKFIISTLFKISLPLAHKVVFLNDDDLEEVQNLVSVPLDTYMLGGIGVDLIEFAYASKTTNSNELVFILVARLLREKGIIEYLEAAVQTCNQYPDVHFWIVGAMDLNPGAINEKELRKYLTHSNIKWLGEVKDVRPLLKKADVFVLPSYREGVPKSTQEALAMGKPVITTDVQGCRETVIHGVNGLLIKSRSSDELAKAFEYFIQHKELLAPYGLESRMLAEKRFDSRVKNQLLTEILLEN